MLTFSPSWSPDGRVIAFVYGDLGRVDFHIALIDVGSRRIESLVDRGIGDLLIQQDTSLAWSPDGSHLLFDVVSSDHCHYLVLYDFKERVSHPLNITFCQGRGGERIEKLDLSWAPGQDPLVGVSHGRSYDDTDDIYMLAQTLTRPEWIAHGGYPVWRPGTKDVSYICSNAKTGHPSLCLYSTQQGSTDLAVQDYSHGKYTSDRYTWSPDGRSILYVETAGESDPVFLSLVDLETGETHHLRGLAEFHWVYIGPEFHRWIEGNVTWSPK
jgi:Tol biopolymer transport system component